MAYDLLPIENDVYYYQSKTNTGASVRATFSHTLPYFFFMFQMLLSHSVHLHVMLTHACCLSLHVMLTHACCLSLHVMLTHACCLSLHVMLTHACCLSLNVMLTNACCVSLHVMLTRVCCLSLHVMLTHACCLSLHVMSTHACCLSYHWNLHTPVLLYLVLKNFFHHNLTNTIVFLHEGSDFKILLSKFLAWLNKQ